MTVDPDPSAAELASYLTASLPGAGPIAPLRWVDHGFGSITCETAAGIIVRIARQPATQQGHAREALTLPLLAPLIEVEIPAPHWRIKPTAAFPYGGIAYPALPGQTPRSDLSARRRTALASDVGRFLSTLHGVSSDVLELPDNRLTTSGLQRLYADLWPTLSDRLTSRELAALDAWFVSAADDAALFDAPAVVRHGDLWFGNLLVDGRGRLTAVLDWEAVAFSDPAEDFSVQRYLGESFLDRVLASYRRHGGRVDPGLVHRIQHHWELRELGGVQGALAMNDDAELAESIAKIRCGPILSPAPRTPTVPG